MISQYSMTFKVASEGLEPSRQRHPLLRRMCLPISPRGHKRQGFKSVGFHHMKTTGGHPTAALPHYRRVKVSLFKRTTLRWFRLNAQGETRTRTPDRHCTLNATCLPFHHLSQHFIYACAANKNRQTTSLPVRASVLT